MFLLRIIAAIAAYFIKGLCGFANTLVFTSILSFCASNANISPIDLLLIPSALLGVFSGIKCSNLMDERSVRKITSVLLVPSGILLILKNL